MPPWRERESAIGLFCFSCIEIETNSQTTSSSTSHTSPKSWCRPTVAPFLVPLYHTFFFFGLSCIVRWFPLFIRHCCCKRRTFISFWLIETRLCVKMVDDHTVSFSASLFLPWGNSWYLRNATSVGGYFRAPAPCTQRQIQHNEKVNLTLFLLVCVVFQKRLDEECLQLIADIQRIGGSPEVKFGALYVVQCYHLLHQGRVGPFQRRRSDLGFRNEAHAV